MYVWLKCEELTQGVFSSERQAKIKVNGYAIVTYSAEDDVRTKGNLTQVRAFVADTQGDKYVLEFPQEIAVLDAPNQKPLGRRVAVPKSLCESA